jgi:hypothetical protein
MKRSPIGVLLCLVGLLITIAWAGCGGTETGNPTGPPSPIDGGGERNPAVELGGAICDKLTVCFDRDPDFTEYCTWTLAVSETLGPALGVEEEPAPGYGEVIEKVENNELSADDVAVEECLNAIESLDCEEDAVQAVDIEQGFANVEEMIPEESCSAVFSVP